MTLVDDPEAFLNAFEHAVTAAGWPEDQWAAVLVSCLIGPTQQTVDILCLPQIRPTTRKLKLLSYNP